MYIKLPTSTWVFRKYKIEKKEESLFYKHFVTIINYSYLSHAVRLAAYGTSRRLRHHNIFTLTQLPAFEMEIFCGDLRLKILLIKSEILSSFISNELSTGFSRKMQPFLSPKLTFLKLRRASVWKTGGRRIGQWTGTHNKQIY